MLSKENIESEEQDKHFKKKIYEKLENKENYDVDKFCRRLAPSFDGVGLLIT